MRPLWLDSSRATPLEREVAIKVLPGEDLATRLSRRASPVDEVLDVCRRAT